MDAERSRKKPPAVPDFLHSDSDASAYDSLHADPWSSRGRSALGWFAVSTLIHVGLLAALTTVSLTVLRTVEAIRVRVVEPASSFDPKDFEGAPSLQDFAGLLEVKPAPLRPAKAGVPQVANVRQPKLPGLPGIGVGAMLGRGPTVDLSAPNLVLGSGGVGGLGGGFGDYIGSLRRVGLDVVLVIDTTKSMQFVIDEVKHRSTDLATAIRRMVPTSRVGIVAYRDHGDEYVVKWVDLSFRAEKLRDFLDTLSAWGGGDWEEAVLDGLDAAIHDLKWRQNSKKIIVLIGGSPPHPQDVKPVCELVREFRASGGHVSAIDVTARLHVEEQLYAWRALGGQEPFQPWPMPAYYHEVGKIFAALTKDGGGELFQLEDDKKLIRDVLVLTFGSRWQVEMASYLKELS